MKKRIGSLLLILALCFTLLPTAAFAAEGSGNTASTKKISVRMNAKNGKSTDSVSDGVSTAYGTTHTLTVTPQTGRYVIAGYFAGTDYYKTNPAKYQYSNMTLHKISEADSQTGAVQYQFTATEVIPISNDPNYDYICLYFHCAKLPTLLWTLGNISGEATAPSTDGNTAAIPYVSQKELCGDPNEYTGYYSLADKKDRPYLDWQVISITDKEGNTAGGTVAFDNNHLTYTPTANEAGKTVTITIRPKLGYVEEANTPLSFEIEVKKPVVEQSEFNVTMVIDGYGNAVARPNSAKEGEEIQLTAIPDRGHHFKEWQATSGTSGKIMITNDKFTMPAGNVTVKAIFEADTYTVKLHANGGTIASGQDVTSYTYGTGAALPTADDITYTGHTFKGWYDNEGLTGDPVTAIGGTETGNKEYWAKWEANTYPVTLNTNGGTINSGKVTSYTYGTGAALPTADDMTYTGYTFKGWYDNESLTGSPVTAIGDTETGNKEYWAKWTINQYTITVKPENGEADITITQDYGTPITAPTLTRDGYQFNGWDKAFPTTMPAEDLTITAQWTLNRYTISYNLNNGTATGNPDSYTVESDAITLNTPTRPGYTFTGWSGTGLDGENNMTVTIPTGSTGERSYTAHWRYNGGGSGGSSSYPITIPGKTENGTVTVSPRSAEKGDTVTITAKPDSGYQLDDLTVTDKNGKELKLTDKGNGKYTFTMPASKVEVNATFVKEVEISPFSDVSTSAYYYEAVKWAQEKGITGGIGNGLFGPNQPCTRAQIVTFLWRAAGSPEPKSMSSFSDVSADSYYAKAVAWAVENGITTGTGDGKFSPDATCTRAQSVTFLFRAIGKLVDSKAEFSDVLTDSYYANAVAWAVENGVTNGIGDGLFGPDNSCTRAQIVTFLFRAYQGK